VTDNHTDNDQASIMSSKRATIGGLSFKRAAAGVHLQHNNSTHSSKLGETLSVPRLKHNSHVISHSNSIQNTIKILPKNNFEVHAPARADRPAKKKISHHHHGAESKPLIPIPSMPASPKNERIDFMGTTFTRRQSEAPMQLRRDVKQMVPDFISKDAIMQTETSQGTIQTTLAPRNKRDKSLKSRMREQTPPKAKKIEDIGVILNRVVRARCCLQP